MRKPSRSYLAILGIVIVTLITSCQGTHIPATPDTIALNSWGDKDSSIIVNRLGKGTAYAMALSPDGKTIAVTGLLSVTTYDFDSLEEIWTSLLEPTQPPISTGPSRGRIAWSPDGDQLATLSEIGISVWDATTGEQLQVFKENQHVGVSSIVWTLEGKLAALESGRGHMILWDVQTGMEIFDFPVNGGVNSFDWIPGEDTLFVASSNGEIVAWDIHIQKQLFSPQKACDGYCLHSLKSSPDGTRLVSNSFGEPDKLTIWDAQMGEQLFTINGRGNHSLAMMAWSPDNNYLAAGFGDGMIVIWDARTGKQLHMWKMNQVLGLAWSPDGNELISLSQYESIIVWDVKMGKQLRSPDEHTSWVMGLAWSPGGDILASGSEDGEVTLWEPSGRKLRSFRDPRGWVRNLTWSPDGKQLASGANNTITIWNAQTGKEIRSWSLDTLALFGLTWSPDRSTLASLSYDGTVILWDASTGKQLRSLGTHRFSESLIWSPKGDLLATSYPVNEAGSMQVTLWNPQTGEPVLTQLGMYDLAWSPSGDVAVSISDNGTEYLRDDTTVVLWDPRTGKELRRFNTGMFLSNIAWSPDGKFLIVGEDQDTDRALIVLDAQTGEQLHRLKGHYDAVTNAVWSPRGDLIASSSWDGTVILWEIDTR